VNKWDRRFIELTRLVATWSEDTSTQVACVLVDPVSKAIISTGYNGLPRGVAAQSVRLARPTKYLYMAHAEQNALHNACSLGHMTRGATAYVLYPPCFDCSRGFIQAGIARVVCPPPYPRNAEGWRGHSADALDMLREAGVEVDTSILPSVE
jgi:dCMP deaminase